MKKYFNIIFCLLFVTAKAQTYQPDHINAKAIALYEKAMVQLNDGEIKNAIPLLLKSIALDSTYYDAALSLAGVYGELKNYSKAEEWYEKIKNKDSNYFKVYHLPYSINLAGEGRFAEALDAINIFLSIPNISERSIKSASYRKRCYEFAVDYKTKHTLSDYSFTPVNLGDSVNSEKSEYYPTLTIDDSLLVFTRRGEGFREDFMESNFNNGNFSKAKMIDGDINNEPSKGAITVSSDGDWMIFAGNFHRGYGDFDLYISYATPQGWSAPENLGPNINSGYWDSSPSLSPDNRVLYFSSNRPGGIGGKDLYMSIRMPNGKWGPAKNMGASINSIGDDTAPYIHADNQTLYFTSDGLQGYGGTDLFICRKDKNGEWSKPENLGYPINTIENEGSIAVASNGVKAYYASDRADTHGGLDLYSFDLRTDVRPYKTLFVKGKVYDAATKKGLPCAVELIDNNNNKILMHIQTDELGKYFIPLPSGKDYTFTVNRKGYLFYSELYELSKKISDSTYQKDIALQPVEMNKITAFKNIQFQSNSYQLLPVSLIELDKLLQILYENPSLKIQINGHTDNAGKESDNLNLSTQRAKSVVDYLISKGIDAKRLIYKGFGASKPLADNISEEGKAKNRRTEFEIIGL
jgi:outer membrane protein OmpA-like peptidoglycan-associated protein